MKFVVKRIRHPLRLLKALSHSSKVCRSKEKAIQPKFVENDGSVTGSEHMDFDTRPEEGILKDDMTG